MRAYRDIPANNLYVRWRLIAVYYVGVIVIVSVYIISGLHV